MAIPPILPPDVKPDAAFYNAAANASVRAWCGWHVAPVITETLVLDGSGAVIQLLPTQRIVSIESATIRGVDVLPSLRWSRRSGVIQLVGLYPPYYGFPYYGYGSACVFPNEPGVLEIVLEHGYDLEDVPDVAQVIAAVQARSASVPAGVLAQSVGGASIRYDASSSGSGSAPLLASEMGLLAPYRLNAGV